MKYNKHLLCDARQLVRLCCLLLVLLFPFGKAAAAETSYTLIISLTDGTEETIHLSRYPVITADAKYVYVKATSFEASYLYADFSEFRFESRTTTDINPATGEKRFGFEYIDNDNVTLSGLSGTEHISLFDASGKQLSMPFDGGEGTITIHLSHLSRGAYIIQVNKQSYKIFKQ